MPAALHPSIRSSRWRCLTTHLAAASSALRRHMVVPAAPLVPPQYVLKYYAMRGAVCGILGQVGSFAAPF